MQLGGVYKEALFGLGEVTLLIPLICILQSLPISFVEERSRDKQKNVDGIWGVKAIKMVN